LIFWLVSLQKETYFTRVTFFLCYQLNNEIFSNDLTNLFIYKESFAFLSLSLSLSLFP